MRTSRRPYLRVVRALPGDVEAEAVVGALAAGWEFRVVALDYLAVGGGSYHWVAADPTGTRRFVTVDDLDTKPWLGDTRNSVFDGLRRAFDTALALRESGLDFVLAPTPTTRGETSRRIGSRYAIAVFPFVDGRAGEFGRYTPTARTGVYEMLARSPSSDPNGRVLRASVGVELPGRRDLEDGLRELNQPWVGGPFSEPARLALASHASDVADLLALADRLAADVTRRGNESVITHGEPHAANVLTAGDDRWLIDWDTVALAPPERDLWMLEDEDDDGAGVTRYVDATGHQPDRTALAFFRLTWDLKDLASFIQVLRSPHGHNEDTEKAYQGVKICASSRHRWTALLDERDTTG